MAAAASIQSFLHALPTINTTNGGNLANHSSSLSFPFEPKTLITLKKTSFKPYRFHADSRILSSSSLVAHAETDEEDYEEEEEEDEDGEGEEVELGKWRAVPSSPEEEGRLYVGNLPYTVTADQLAEIFSQAGTVEAAEVVYDRVTDRSRGFAFVTMASSDDAKAAIRMFNGTQVGGRTVKVNFPEVPRGGEREVMGPRTRASSRGYMDSPYKVYVGNLGWSVSSEILKDTFSHLPGLLGAKVIYESFSGRSRGYGFVSFTSPKDAQFAIETMNGKEVEGRPLRLNLAGERSSTASATV